MDSTCVTFLAKTTTDTIVVKFVQRYGAEAHHLLATEKLAPPLLYCGKVGVRPGDPSYGHLQMVVMGYIDGETLDMVIQTPPNLRDRLRRALDILHEKDYVFGDLRRPNVMITKNEEVMLIDFDWVGLSLVSRYPLLISLDLAWPIGVDSFAIMETGHDDAMLVQLLGEEKL